MITEAPNHGHFSVIEKLLVDFYVEAEELSLLDRSEYWQVQGRVIGNGRVDIATMIRYARRRKLNPIEVFPWLKSIIERRISNATIRTKKEVARIAGCNRVKEAETQRDYRFPRTGR
ncbi:MAG: hypothetical protein KJ808_07690, partial [Acidobacteria bacterium]|nr:hypothetical protein [Acidobacteriota bacterium]